MDASGSSRSPSLHTSRLARRRFLTGLILTGAGLPLLAACGGAAATTLTTTSAASVATTASPAASSAAAAPTATTSTSARVAAASTSSAATASSSAAPAASTQQAGGQQRTLDLWLQDVYYKPGTLGDTFIKEFAQQHAEIKVVSEPMPYSTTKLPQVVAAGTGPDLAHMDRYLAAEWGIKGIIQSLDALLGQSKALNPADWRDGLRSDVTWKGKIYAVPQGSDVWLFYWNKTVYREVGLPVDTAPATWDELKQSAQKLYRTNPDGTIDRYGFAPQFGNGGAQAAWLIFMWQQGQDELSEDRTKAIFNTDKGLNALNLVIDLITMQGGMQHYTDFLKALSTNARAAALPAGKIVSHLDYQGLPPNIWKPAFPTFATDMYGAGLIPKPPNGKDTTYQGGPTEVIPTPAKNPADAFRFLEYINTPENQVRWADGIGAVPTAKSVLASDAYLSKDPTRKVYATLGLGGKWVPVVPGAADILKIHSQFMNDALNGVKTPHDALAAAQDDIQKVLDKNLAGT